MADRDYAAEYRHRLARGLAKGQSRSQARGHARAGEQQLRPRAPKFDLRLEAGLKALRRGGSLTAAAKTQRVSAERMRVYIKSLPFVEKRAGRFVVGTDRRRRQVEFYADGRLIKTIVEGYEPAVLAGSHWEAAAAFRKTNELSGLAPFVGAQITDVYGRTYTLETRPNVLYRLGQQGAEPFEQIYQIVI